MKSNLKGISALIKSHVLRAKFAAKVRSLAVTIGPLSLAGRIRPEAVEIIARLFAPTASSDIQDSEVLAALSRFHTQKPEHFLTYQEAMGLLQEKKVGLGD